MSGITAESSRRYVETLEREAEAKIAALEKNLKASRPTERDAIRRQVDEIRAELMQRIRSLDACLF